MNTGALSLEGILETSLYVSDLDRSARFYQTLFGSKELVRDDRLCALSIGSTQVLLLFQKGASLKPGVTPGGTIPPHDGHARQAFHRAGNAWDMGNILNPADRPSF
jgi:catechol 2,3-dioxygenase-like lactoylglutathione lyase family enzyme